MKKNVLLIILTVLVALSAGLITYKLMFFNKSSNVVPKMTHLNLGEAEELLKQHGLNYKVTKIDNTEPGQDDPVLNQKPNPGTKVWEKMIVELVVANPMKELPDIDSLEVAEAVRIVVEKGFTVTDTVYCYNEYIPAGLAAGYEGQSNHTILDKPVTIVVSKGPQMAYVPDVIGLHFSKAEKMLQEAGFSNFEYSRMSSKIIPSQCVVDVDPKEGLVKRSATLHIYISSGKGK